MGNRIIAIGVANQSVVWGLRIRRIIATAILLCVVSPSVSNDGVFGASFYGDEEQAAPRETGLSTSASGDESVRDESTPKSATASDDALRALDEETLEKSREEREKFLLSYDYAALDDEPAALKRLDKTAPIWAAKDRSRVVLGGDVCLREGDLEFFACRRYSKEHESIIALDAPPHLIHAALLAIGAKQGAPAKFEPKFTPPSGDVVEIEVRWRDPKTNEVEKIRAQEMILESGSDKTMSSNWVFTGGLFGVDPDGKKYYLANVTGEVFGVSNFPGAVLDVPFESTSDSAHLFYAANPKKIPPIGTPVSLTLRRATAKPELGTASK